MKVTTRIGFASIAAVALALPAGIVHAQGKHPLVGMWQLVSATNTDDKGNTKVGSFGPNPAGRVVYTESGQYISLNTSPNLPKYDNRMKGSPDDYKGVVHGSIGSYGTWSVSPDGKALTIRQEAGTFAIRNGTEEKRDFELKGDEMTYWTRATYGGRSELRFKRVK